MAYNPYAQYSYFEQPGIPAPYSSPQQYPQTARMSMPTSSGPAQQGSGIGGAIGGPLQAGFGIFQSIKNNKLRKQREAELEQAVNSMPEYTESPIVKGMVAQAQAQQNAINPAVMAMYQQAQQQAANTMAAAQRNASSGPEAINAALMAQNIANSQAPQAALQQTQYNMANRANLQNTQSALNNERQNVFNSRVAKNDALQNLKTMQFGNAQKLWQDAWGNIIGGANATGNAVGSIIGGGI